MSVSSLVAARGGAKRHSRESIIAAIQRWNELYGEPPRAADLNPSAAKWSAQEWRIPRYRAGDPVTGEPWPSLNAVKGLFDGSLNAAVIAAGLEPGKPGPSRRKDVIVERAREQMPPDARVALDAALAEVRDLRERLEVRDRMLARSREAVERARAEARKTKTIVRTRTVKERVVDERAVRRAEKRALEAEQRAALAIAETASIRKEAENTSRVLARREKALEDLRAEKAELKRALSRAERAVAEVREVRVPVEKIVERVIEVESVTPAEAEVRDARARAEAAEARADHAVAAYQELAVSVSGRRDLSLTEARELSRNGPAGPAILAGALKALAVARKSGTTAEVRKALRDVASAAVSWSDRV